MRLGPTPRDAGIRCPGCGFVLPPSTTPEGCGICGLVTLNRQAAARCTCPAPVPLRSYAGAWTCRLCGRPVPDGAT
jgi:hypothetical protein